MPEGRAALYEASGQVPVTGTETPRVGEDPAEERRLAADRAGLRELQGVCVCVFYRQDLPNIFFQYILIENMICQRVCTNV